MKTSSYFVPNTNNKGGYQVVNQLLKKHVLAVVNSRPQTCSLIKPHAHVNASRKKKFIHADDLYIDQERSKESKRLQSIISHMKRTYVDNRVPDSFNIKVTNLMNFDKNIVLQDHARNVKSLITKIDEINKKSNKKIRFIRKQYMNFPTFNPQTTSRNFKDKGSGIGEIDQQQQRSSSAMKKKSLKFKYKKKLKKMQSLSNNEAFLQQHQQLQEQIYQKQQPQLSQTKYQIKQQQQLQQSPQQIQNFQTTDHINNSCYDLYDISQKADRILQKPAVSDLTFLKKLCKIKKCSLFEIENNLKVQEPSSDESENKKMLKRNILDVIVQKQIYSKNALRELEYLVIKINPEINQYLVRDIFTELQNYIFK